MRQRLRKPVTSTKAAPSTLITPWRELRRKPGEGRPLDERTQSSFAPHFGFDLSRVRIHDDPRAHDDAATLGARAFTEGWNVSFAPGQYSPGTSRGDRLLAHELAHVAQQSHVADRPVKADSVGVSSPGDASEREAASMAKGVLSGAPARAPSSAPVSVQREMLGDDPAVESPGLSQSVYDTARAHLSAGHWQKAVDAIVAECIRTGQIDPGQIVGGRVFYDPDRGRDKVEGEGDTDVPGFRRNRRTGSLTAVRRKVRVGRDGFKHGVPWLYSTILHEYKHVQQEATRSGLPTIASAVPGQRTDDATNAQQDVETYSEEIFRARDTGVANHRRLMLDLWDRLNDNYGGLDAAHKRPVRDLYIRAHAAGEAILGPGSLKGYRP